ncbi:MAG: NADP-specific glutamate dehydrogenase [Pseudomonadota bacterium]
MEIDTHVKSMENKQNNPDSVTSGINAFDDWLKGRNPNQTDFQHAVQSVVKDVLPIVQKDERLLSSKVLQRLTEPDRIVSFRVVWEDDENEINVNRGYRVQHTNALGPYKGGLRFSPEVNADVLKFLAFEQAFKNSLTGLDLGAGKGGADFDPRGRSDREIMRFCQAFMTELYRHIGPEADVPAGDIGVGEREIGYLFGQYRRISKTFSGTLTGKRPMAGGSELRTEATGFGAVYFLCHMLTLGNVEIEGKRVAISGAGNVALHAAQKAVQLDANVITLSNRAGTLYHADGLSEQAIQQAKTSRAQGSTLEEIADDLGAEWFADKKPWTRECDIAIPSATQNEVNAGDAKSLADGRCGYLIEAANKPLTEDAEGVLAEAGVAVGPGKAANAGGVAVSGFEMAQNRLGISWSRDRVDDQLRETMKRIFVACVEHSDSDDAQDLRRGANIAGFRRLADALVSSGAV